MPLVFSLGSQVLWLHEDLFNSANTLKMYLNTILTTNLFDPF